MWGGKRGLVDSETFGSIDDKYTKISLFLRLLVLVQINTILPET